LLNDSKVQELSLYWNEGSKEDLESARIIVLQGLRFAPGLFFLHLSLEKAFKSYYVLRFKDHAPFTHNLVSLVEKLEWDVPEEQSADLSEEVI
jgi:HEPN domain-containing protein